MNNIDLLFEVVTEEQEHIDEFNRQLQSLDEKKRKMCTIHPTDSGNKIRKKCKVARVWGVHYAPVWDRYMSSNEPGAETDAGASDASASGGESVIEKTSSAEIVPPMEDGDENEEVRLEAMSSTERVRKYYRKHPEKVRKYLKKTQKDRVARNRDRRKAIKKHGKAKMKNHDVHHPKGPNGGSWRLAKKDHGPDKKKNKKKNESIQPTTPLLLEAAPGSHVMHPYDDVDMKFTDFKDIVHQALVGDFGGQATEKYDGQTLLFTYRDGKVKFARNTQHTKNYGEKAMTADEYKEYFSGHGDKISKVFAQAAKDTETAIAKIPPKELEAIFGDGNKFVLSELLSTELPNTIPYGSDRVVMLNIRNYDTNTGNPVNEPIDRFAADKLMSLVKQHSDPDAGQFKLSGNTKLEFDTSKESEFKEKESKYIAVIDKLRSDAGVPEDGTLGDYFAKKWNSVLDSTKLQWTPEERSAMVNRWVNGEKTFGSKDLQDPAKKEAFRKIEADYKSHVANMTDPFKTIILRSGNDAVNRANNIVSKNDGTLERMKATLAKASAAIKASGNKEYIEKTKEQLKQLKKLGPDSVIPSEGLILQRNGKLYKMTGGFTPVNQIVGIYTYKLNPAKAPSTAQDAPPAAQKKQPVAAPVVAPKQAKKSTATKKKKAPLTVMTKQQKTKARSMMDRRITNPETGNQILIKTALKYDKSRPVYKAASATIKSGLLNEGGNAVSANSKIPNRFAQSTAKFAAKSIGFDKLQRQMVGSTEKPLMGDLDIAVDINDVKNMVGYHGDDIKQLFGRLKAKLADVGMEVTYSPGFQQISILAPLVDDTGKPQAAYDAEGRATAEQGAVQVDFMIGNLAWMKRGLTNGSTSKYSSTFRNILMADTLGSLIFDTENPDVKWKYQINSRVGLERIEFTVKPNGKREVLKKELVSTDIEDLAKVLFGEKAKFSDIDTFDKLNDKIKAPDSPLKDLAPTIYDKFIKSINDKKMTVPPEVPVASQKTDAPVKATKPIAIYPGRFQPYHAGHHVTYDAMVEKFGKDNVYIATSNKQDDATSPFGFKEKKDIMTTMFGIPEDKIVQVKNTYNPQEILSKFPDSTSVVFAVGEKDAERLGGKYFEPYDPDTPMSGHKTKGYVWVGPPPNIEINGKTISGTQLRAALGDPNITDRAKQEIFTSVYGKFNKTIFSKVVRKAMEAEEAKSLTQMYGKSAKKTAPVSSKTKAVKKSEPAKRKAPEEAEVELDRALFKPGQTWETETGKFGGKNSKGKIGYFSTQEKAKLYAKK